MHFLADESCDLAVVRALRSQGFDVIAVSETCPDAEDQRVIELARKEGWIPLRTLDAWLIFQENNQE